MVGDELTRPFRDARRFPSRAEGYTHAANVWGLSVVQVPNPNRPIRSFHVAVHRTSLYRLTSEPPARSGSRTVSRMLAQQQSKCRSGLSTCGPRMTNAVRRAQSP
jgi:hypothetical protein